MGFFQRAGSRIRAEIDKSQESKKEEQAIRSSPEFQQKIKKEKEQALLRRDTARVREQYKFVPGQRSSGGGILDTLGASANQMFGETKKGKSKGGFPGMGSMGGFDHLSSVIGSDVGGKSFGPGFQSMYHKKKEEKKKGKTITIHLN